MVSHSPRGLGFTDHELLPGEHICALYDNRLEQEAVAVPFVQVGLQHHQRVAFMGEERAALALQQALQEAGLPVQQHLANGDLLFLCREQAFRRGSLVAPDAMLQMGKRLVRASLAQGWPLVRLLGDYAWLLRTRQDITRWLAYESKLNYEVPGLPAIIVCQYDRTRLPADFVDKIIRTHPVAVVGGLLQSNPFYKPPTNFLAVACRPD